MEEVMKADLEEEKEEESKLEGEEQDARSTADVRKREGNKSLERRGADTTLSEGYVCAVRRMGKRRRPVERTRLANMTGR
mmetsp:Transcript_48760/g.122682  ORF Transcript_48760/g.122682 Transcript_48760/m.122682 type:complete len:80 (+) Transcript_48760:1080-1319(+)